MREEGARGGNIPKANLTGSWAAEKKKEVENDLKTALFQNILIINAKRVAVGVVSCRETDSKGHAGDTCQ